MQMTSFAEKVLREKQLRGSKISRIEVKYNEVAHFVGSAIADKKLAALAQASAKFAAGAKRKI
eukprot:11193858-Lingulodinium_polyedra.AAC.1